jgi:hypothetical protein
MMKIALPMVWPGSTVNVLPSMVIGPTAAPTFPEKPRKPAFLPSTFRIWVPAVEKLINWPTVFDAEAFCSFSPLIVIPTFTDINQRPYCGIAV